MHLLLSFAGETSTWSTSTRRAQVVLKLNLEAHSCCLICVQVYPEPNSWWVSASSIFWISDLLVFLCWRPNTDQFCFSMCLKGQDFRGVLDWGLVKGCSPRGWVGTAQVSQGTGHSTTPDRVPETFGQCSQVNSGICGVSCAGREARLWSSLWVHSILLLLFYYSAIPRERPFLKI